MFKVLKARSTSDKQKWLKIFSKILSSVCVESSCTYSSYTIKKPMISSNLTTIWIIDLKKNPNVHLKVTIAWAMVKIVNRIRYCNISSIINRWFIVVAYDWLIDQFYRHIKPFSVNLYLEVWESHSFYVHNYIFCVVVS